MAAGKPILCDFPSRYNPVVETGCGVDVENPTPENIARAIERFTDMDTAEYQSYCVKAKDAAEKYSFEAHAAALSEIVGKLNKSGVR